MPSAYCLLPSAYCLVHCPLTPDISYPFFSHYGNSKPSVRRWCKTLIHRRGAWGDRCSGAAAGRYITLRGAAARRGRPGSFFVIRRRFRAKPGGMWKTNKNYFAVSIIRRLLIGISPELCGKPCGQSGKPSPFCNCPGCYFGELCLPENYLLYSRRKVCRNVIFL